MGQPEYLNSKDIQRLEETSQLASRKQAFDFRDGSVSFKVTLPAHAIAAVTVDFKPQARRSSK